MFKLAAVLRLLCAFAATAGFALISLHADVPQPLIRQIQPNVDGSVLLRWDAVPGSAYRVLAATDPASGDWTPVDYILATSNSVTWEANGQGGVARFYKLSSEAQLLSIVEPSTVPAGSETAVYLTGQGFGSNDVLRLTGLGGPWVLTNRVVIDSTLIMFMAGPGFTPDIPGEYGFELVSGSTGKTTGLKSATLTVSATPGGSVHALYEPPQDPPAIPNGSVALNLSSTLGS